MNPTIEQRLRARICPNCVRRTSSGGCSLPADRPCSLFANLDEIVSIVRETHSKRIDPYVETLRDRVCGACHFQDDHGRCPCREGVDCALDTYYPLIVEEIERELAL
ncbi:MAG: hypothetical protein KDA33_13685 [Phycisphaerales bacterium]|nr:hypothetical protein [Phycisphaerales bacterium]